MVKQLRLADDPTFIRSGVDPLDRFLARLGWGDPDPKSEPERVDAAIAALNKGLNIQRLGPSYLVGIDFQLAKQGAGRQNRQCGDRCIHFRPIER